MCVRVYMYISSVYTYVYADVYRYACVYVYIDMACIGIYICMHMCMCVRIYVYPCIIARVFMYIYTKIPRIAGRSLSGRSGVFHQ